MNRKKYSLFIPFFFIIFIINSQSTTAQWIKQLSGASENLTDVIMLDSMKAIVIGDRNGIFRTTDAGSTWINETIMLSAVFHWNAISFSDSLNGTIVGDDAIWETTDGGITWDYRNIPSSHKNLSVLQINPENIYVGDDSGYVHHSIDSGKTWISEKLSNLPVCSIYPIKANPQIFSPFQMLIYALTPNSLFVKNLNDTSSWKNWGALGYFRGLGSRAFKGGFSEDGTEFIVGVEGDLISQSTIIRLRPIDSHWYFVGPSSEIGVLRGLSIPSSNIIYTCGSYGKILKSENSGDDWISLKTPISHALNSIYFFDNERGFAVGDSGIILYTENGGITAIDNNLHNIPEGFKLYQNYPNPFNPTTTIKYELPKESNVQLVIYNILGEKVAELVNSFQEAGTYGVTWNAESGSRRIASGVYICQIKANDPAGGTGFISSKKLILLK